MYKKGIALLVAVLMVMTMVPSVAFADTTYSDMPNDWSRTALEHAVENGLLSGYPDGTIRAGRNMTRAEMVTILANAFGAVNEADISEVKDVSRNAWYYDYIARSIKMEGIVLAAAVRPNDPITRQEAFTVLCKVMLLQNTDSTYSSLNKFLDASEVSGWAKGFLNAMSENGYVSGSASGRLHPLSNITRAEFAAVMNNMFKQYIDAPTAETVITADGNVVVRGAGTLKDVTINGDLIIADGVDLGKVILDNVIIKGRIIVRGGTEVHFTGKADGDIIVWADNCTVYANSGKDSFNNYFVDGNQSQVVLPNTSGGGGSGSGGGGNPPGDEDDNETENPSATTDFAIGIEMDLSLTMKNTFTRKPTYIIGYTMDTSVGAVMQKFVDQNEITLSREIDDAIEALDDRGYLTSTGAIKSIAVPAGNNITKEVLTSSDSGIKDAVVEAITSDSGLKQQMKEALKLDESADVDSAIGSSVDSVLEALTGDGELNYEDRAQEIVIEQLQNKLNQYKPEDLHKKIENNGNYKQYLEMLGDKKDEQIDALAATVIQYNEQLQKMLDKFNTDASRASTMVEGGTEDQDEDMIRLPSNDNNLQTYIPVDPIKALQNQYETRRSFILNRIQNTSEVAAWLETLEPINWVGQDNKLLSGSDYYGLLADQWTALYDMHKTWEPAESYATSKDDAIQKMIDEAKTSGGSILPPISTTQTAVLKAMFGDEAKATGAGLDMTMETFFNTVLERPVDDGADNTYGSDDDFDDNRKSAGESKFTIKMEKLPEGNNSAPAIKSALSWIREVYPKMQFTGKIKIEWFKPN